jgi:predicted GNAT family acetyltransferase
VSAIEHQSNNNRFVLSKSGSECVLDYRLMEIPSGQKVDFTHTYVPSELRGKGLAELLVEAGLAWAKEQGYEIEASCWYVNQRL